MKPFLCLSSALLTVITFTCTTTLLAQNTSPFWSLAGNSNATAASKLGTTNAVDVGLFTNNLDRMHLTSAGLVGVNITVPKARFHVNSPTGQNALLAAVNGKTKLLVHSNGGVAIGNASTPPTNGLYILGNTGIGTNTPGSKLHVVGNALFTDHVEISEAGLTATNNAGDAIIGIGSANGVYGYGAKYGVQGQGSGAYSYGVSGNGFVGVYATNTGISGDALRALAYDASAYGVNAYSSQSIGVFSYTANPGSYAGYFSGNVYSSGTYTGSDRLLKQDIAEVKSALDIIKKLAPKSYTFRQDGDYKLMNLPAGKHYGLIAQDVEQVLPGLVKNTTFETGKILAAQNKSANNPNTLSAAESRENVTFKALNYTELIPIAIKGLQELAEENDALKAENQSIRQELADLRQLIMSIKNDNPAGTAITGAFLGQNYPNPVAGNTTISYSVPAGAAAAHLAITNVKGQLVKTVRLQPNGAGQLTLSTAPFASGAYHYTLWVEGKQIDTRQLIVAR